MDAVHVVVAHVSGEQALQVLLVERDDVIE
jgi:hypothetical protein